MQRYTQNYFGPWMYLSANSSDQIVVNAGYRSLSCPDTTVKGDFRRPNPWSYSVIENNYAKGFISSYDGGKWSQTISGYFQLEATAFFDTSGLAAMVYNECLSKLAERIRGNLNAAVSIAEGGQTIRMLNLSDRLTTNLSAMKSSYDQRIMARLRQLRGRKALTKALKRWQKNNVQTLPLAKRYYKPRKVDHGFVSRVSALGANGWLEFTYGWSPLVSDIRAIGLNLVGRARKYFRATASSKQTFDQSRVESPTHSYGQVRESASGFVSCRISVTMRPGFDPGLSEWTSLNPLLVGYELIPYSFVFDWAFNLGSYLENLEQSLRFQNQFDYGYVSTLSVADYHWEESGRTLGGDTYRVVNRTAKKRVVNFTRSLSYEYPLPSFPSVELNLGSSRLLSMASLLRQLIK